MLKSKAILGLAMAGGVLAGTLQLSGTPVLAKNETPILHTESINGKLSYIGNYQTGMSNKDGGIAEIVKYNKDNQKMYLVNGAAQSVDIVSMANMTSNNKTEFKIDTRLDIAAMGQAHGFASGDITSIDINTNEKMIAIAVQGATYKDNGSIVILNYDGKYIKHFEAGVQPDMVTFSHDYKYLLSANEGEPREGYSAVGATDPKGSITVIDIKKGVNKATAQTIGFDEFDSQEARATLVENGVLLKPDTAPSVDLEPEYISVSDNSRYAYVSLQEANSVATIDLKTQEIISVKGLGFKDHNVEENALDALKDGQVNLTTQNLYGTYMPDGIDSQKIGGKQYLFTANEGDGREWEEYEDTGSYTFPGTSFKIDTILNTERDGLEADKTYIYGSRSFSIWDADTMEQVYDSGSDFEKITGELYPEAFNSSNNKTELDSRSGKKGPEPEDIKVMKVNGKTFAFIGLERTGGIMMYDVTNVQKVKFHDYVNLRDFTGTDVSSSGDLAPEGLCLVEAKNSPTGKPLMLVANEVSGNVRVFEINGR
ncbi:secreted protein [Mycobacteroides abscessus subsp. abscessus]|nr:secreted protein [Mycobacteroides abscessus subsp. abscessus]